MKSAILLTNPKFPHNLGAIVRTCSCYGVPDLLYTGTRMDKAISLLDRLPREERMKGYKNVNWRHSDKPFDDMSDYVPVAVEIRENAEMLQNFKHPENALYVFGPEDGSVQPVFLRHCHHFVAIPTSHCLNLGTAVATVLYDRMAKLDPNKRLDMATTEDRGWVVEEEFS